MDNRTNLVIKSRDTSRETNYTTTITYVNPSATNEKLVALATAINALTGNSITTLYKDSREVLA